MLTESRAAVFSGALFFEYGAAWAVFSRRAIL